MQGTLDVLILRALMQAPLHGYDVVAWIRAASGGALEIEDGALYTSLHRMEARRWLIGEWKTSPKGRRARYYKLSAEGRRQLELGEGEWAAFSSAVNRIFTAGEA